MFKDPFSLFNLPAVYEIDEGALEEKYYELQRAFHPDRLLKAGRSGHLKSADINTAYQILKHPLERAKALLAMKQVAIDEATKIEDPAFLMEIMDVQEALNEEPDASLFMELKTQRKGYEKDMLQAFQKQDYTKAKDCVLKLNYLDKILKKER